MKTGPDYTSRETHRDRSPRPARHGPPTDCVPGSPEKEAVLAARYSRGLSLHSPGDAALGEWFAVNARLLALVVCSEMPAEEAQRRATQARRQLGHIEVRSAKEQSGDHARKIPRRVSTPHVSGRVREARRRAGLSARRAAELAGMSHTALLAVESRRLAPSLLTLWRLSDALGCDIDWLACFERRGDAVLCRCA